MSKKELVDSLTGKNKEPEFFEGKLIFTKMDLVKALTWYSHNAKLVDLRDYAVEWSRSNAPDLTAALRKAPAWAFLTWGAMCRISERGFVLDEKHAARLRDEIRRIATTEWTESEDSNSDAPVITKKVRRPKPNPTFEAFDAALDRVMVGEEASFAVDPKDNLAEIAAYIDCTLKEIAEEPEQYEPKYARRLTAWLKAAAQKLGAVKKAVKTRVVAPRKVDPHKAVRDVKFAKTLDIVKFKTGTPLEMVGRKKAYVYDAKYRRLIMFVASVAAGFTFRGTTLLNVDLEKSSFKTLRKPEQFFSSYGSDRPTISDLNKRFNELTGKRNAITTGRFNENFSIIQVASV